jgi:opine dehydrogenase
MKLAILGAGAVGPAAAALAVSRGHQVTLWSPRGGGTHGIGATLTSEGALSGIAKVDVAVDAGRALAGAEAVLVCVPPHALGPVLRRIAPMLPAEAPVILSPSHSLAPLLLDRLLARHGMRVPVGGMALPPVVATRTGPDRVRLLAIREQVEIGAVPAAAADALARLCAGLFGVSFVPMADALGAALATAEPVLQAAVAMGNLTRIEGAEAWDLHAGMTSAVCRVMARLDAERLALAAAYGHAVPPLAEQLAGTAGVKQGPLPEMARAMAVALGPTPGPQGLDAAHLAESVTYGLALWLRLAAPKGVPMPLTAAAIALLEAMWGTALSTDDLLEGLDLARLPELLRDGHGG